MFHLPDVRTEVSRQSLEYRGSVTESSTKNEDVTSK